MKKYAYDRESGVFYPESDDGYACSHSSPVICSNSLVSADQVSGDLQRALRYQQFLGLMNIAQAAPGEDDRFPREKIPLPENLEYAILAGFMECQLLWEATEIARRR